MALNQIGDPLAEHHPYGISTHHAVLGLAGHVPLMSEVVQQTRHLQLDIVRGGHFEQRRALQSVVQFGEGSVLV